QPGAEFAERQRLLMTRCDQLAHFLDALQPALLILLLWGLPLLRLLPAALRGLGGRLAPGVLPLPLPVLLLPPAGLALLERPLAFPFGRPTLRGRVVVGQVGQEAVGVEVHAAELDLRQLAGADDVVHVGPDAELAGQRIFQGAERPRPFLVG